MILVRSAIFKFFIGPGPIRRLNFFAGPVRDFKVRVGTDPDRFLFFNLRPDQDGTVRSVDPWLEAQIWAKLRQSFVLYNSIVYPGIIIIMKL